MRKDNIEIESGMSWTSAIAGALWLLEAPKGARHDKLCEIREDAGVGGDTLNAGFLRLAIAAALYLDSRIESYGMGVFSYEHLETGDNELPAVLVDSLTVSEWADLAGNWHVPQERLEIIIDGWLDGPRFDQYRVEKEDFALRPKPITELKKFEVDVRGMVRVSRKVMVTAANAQDAANDALANTSRALTGWEVIGEAVTQSYLGVVNEVASA